MLASSSAPYVVYFSTDPGRIEGWVDLVGWMIADALPGAGEWSHVEPAVWGGSGKTHQLKPVICPLGHTTSYIQGRHLLLPNSEAFSGPSVHYNNKLGITFLALTTLQTCAGAKVSRRAVHYCSSPCRALRTATCCIPWHRHIKCCIPAAFQLDSSLPEYHLPSSHAVILHIIHLSWAAGHHLNISAPLQHFI